MYDDYKSEDLEEDYNDDKDSKLSEFDDYDAKNLDDTSDYEDEEDDDTLPGFEDYDDEESEDSKDTLDYEDEEDDDVRLVLAPGVGTQQGADEQHGRARGANPAGEQGAHHKHDDVVARGAGDEALHRDATRHYKQAEQQHDERYVVEHNRFSQLIGQLVPAVDDGERDAEEQRPKNGDEELVLLIPGRYHQRHDGDGKQHARKRDDAP